MCTVKCFIIQKLCKVKMDERQKAQRQREKMHIWWKEMCRWAEEGLKGIGTNEVTGVTKAEEN